MQVIEVKNMDLKFKNNLMKANIFVIGILITSIAFSGCIESNGDDNSDLNDFYSFEKSMQGWEKNGTDLDNPPIHWDVNRSDEMASDKDYSIKFYLENFNDAGKIWMEKYFDVQSDSLYQVNVSFKFATADFGDLNLFNLITTVQGTPFNGREDLNYEGDTGHHTESQDFVWLDKSFEYIVQTDSDGQIYINIGVWGSWETTRTYYVDELNISFEKLEEIQNYPNISGEWTLKHYNFEGNLTSEENVTINQVVGEVEILFSLGLPVTGKIIKNNIENPEHQTDFIIRGIDFRGLGIDVIYIINESLMYTELPLCETCNPSVFSR
jgi:hypothetical protein